jgi:glycerol uptake facilitator-like aquaporin
VRSGPPQWFAELVATFALLLTILALVRFRIEAVPYAVGLYITAAYWFTSSTSFASPAVTLARSLTDTFAGISPLNGPMFMAAQVAGISPRWSRWVGSGHPNRISKNVEITIDTLIQRLRLFP